MNDLSMNAQNVGSSSTNHKFPFKWNLTDLEKIEKNGLKVFSCFSCGGGSSMGYKLSGYELLGNCEIDPGVIEIYRKNHHPKYSFLMDVRDFINQDLPEELYNLDVLDGSPPCSTFSMAGDRDKGWGVEKQFREGQAKQRLDDLFFHFIAIAKKLQPKVVVAENVKGLIQGNAKGYVNEIIRAYDDAGYKVQIFLLNAATMGVPQARERVFFIAHRKDLDFPKLVLRFNEKPITFGEVRSEKGLPVNENSHIGYLLQRRRPEDTKISDINKRLRGKNIGFTQPILSDNKVACTLTSGAGGFRMYDGMGLSDQDCINIQTFPQDYDFGKQQVKYICGMSVPPVMMAQISLQIYEQWFKTLQ